jgi:hypothetical protein
MAACVSGTHGETRYDATKRRGDLLDEEEFAQ